MLKFFKKGEKKDAQHIAQLSELTGKELAEEGLNQIALAIKARSIEIQPGKIFSDIYAHGDKPAGVPRFTYVMFSPTVQNEVIARCTIIYDSQKDGVGCWQIDWAVLEKYRGYNWGSTIAKKALTEFVNGMQRVFPNGFIVEAIVDQDNEASKKIAGSLIGDEEVILDENTGRNVHSYLKRF